LSPLPFPSVVRLEPSAGCNLACSHCPTGTVTMKRGVMGEEVFQRALDAIRDHIDAIRVVVLYHGGEPLLHKRFPEMIRRVKDLGVPFVKTVSNGMLLGDDEIKGLADSGLDCIEVSIDEESPVLSDFVRRNSDCQTILANVGKLVDRKRAEKPEVIICQVSFVDPGTFRQGDEPQVAAHLLEAFPDGRVGFKTAWAFRFPHMEVDEEIYDQFRDPFDDEDGTTCDHVLSTITIRADGNVIPCCYDLTSQMVMGNILDDDLESIWNNRAYFELRQGIATRTYPPLCTNCNIVRPNVYLVLRPEIRKRLGGTQAS